jgi:hypothetical protein
MVSFTCIMVVGFALLTFKGYDGLEPSFTNLLVTLITGLAILTVASLYAEPRNAYG